MLLIRMPQSIKDLNQITAALVSRQPNENFIALQTGEISFSSDREECAMMNVYGYERILLDGVKVWGAEGRPLIRTWSKEGEILARNLECDRDVGELYAYQTEAFHTKAI